LLALGHSGCCSAAASARQPAQRAHSTDGVVGVASCRLGGALTSASSKGTSARSLCPSSPRAQHARSTRAARAQRHARSTRAARAQTHARSTHTLVRAETSTRARTRARSLAGCSADPPVRCALAHFAIPRRISPQREQPLRRLASPRRASRSRRSRASACSTLRHTRHPIWTRAPHSSTTSAIRRACTAMRLCCPPDQVTGGYEAISDGKQADFSQNRPAQRVLWPRVPRSLLSLQSDRQRELRAGSRTAGPHSWTVVALRRRGTGRLGEGALLCATGTDADKRPASESVRSPEYPIQHQSNPDTLCSSSVGPGQTRIRSQWALHGCGKLRKLPNAFRLRVMMALDFGREILRLASPRYA
jgi:hypothetical protein